MRKLSRIGNRMQRICSETDCERTSLKALKIVVRNFTKHSRHDFYICTYITD